MAVIGISLIVASVVIFCLRPPAWLPVFLTNIRLGRISDPPPRPPVTAPDSDSDSGEDEEVDEDGNGSQDGHARREESGPTKQPMPIIQELRAHQDAGEGNGASTQPTPTIREPQEEGARNSSGKNNQREVVPQYETRDEEQTTPKASATLRDDDAVPSLVLPECPPITRLSPSAGVPPQQTIPSLTTTPPPQLNIVPEPPKGAAELMPPPPPPSFASKNTTSRGTSATTPAPTTASALMPPPPAPKTKIPRPSGIPQPRSSAANASTSPRRIPTLNGTASPAPARNLPIPRRGAPPPGGSSAGGGLAPPPTATSIPKKPSRQVTLEPGHSPLDWARLAQSPTSDLRGLPADAPYLRVTPSMLKQQNGRKGRDAWSVFGGKVYNISPYIPFHPGGGPELLRGAGKDGTRLFAEVHPWVNYETMLQSCLIGLLVDEHEAENQMEEMD